MKANKIYGVLSLFADLFVICTVADLEQAQPVFGDFIGLMIFVAVGFRAFSVVYFNGKSTDEPGRTWGAYRTIAIFFPAFPLIMSSFNKKKLDIYAVGFAYFFVVGFFIAAFLIKFL